MPKAVVAYIPVLHEGYYSFLRKHADAAGIYVLDRSILKEVDWLRKDLRALPPEMAARGVESWGIGPEVKVISVDQFAHPQGDVELVMPDEDVSHILVEKYWGKRPVAFDPIFLRWNRRNTGKRDAVNPQHRITREELDRQFMLIAAKESSKATNIWRHVGAAMVKDGKTIGVASNRHQPTEHTPWIDGDVRMNFERGAGIEMSTDMHAEPILIGRAARKGESIDGADLYVTTFPCPPCAMLIANSGIRRLFYAEGYAVLDGERVLEANGVELIKVDMELPQDRGDALRPYPEK